MSRRIVGVLRIDIEPEGIDAITGARPWEGFLAAKRLVDALRPRLSDRSGCAQHPAWLVRLDPHIEHCFGRADFVVANHRAAIDQLREAGDAFGIHVHPYRWDKGRLFSEHADGNWTTHCLRVAAQAFERCLGEPVRRMSAGGYFLSEPFLDAAIELGIEVDVTAEPGLAPKLKDKTFGDYATAPTPDFRRFPLTPYYPSRSDMARPAATTSEARRILMVPLTSYDYKLAARSWPRRVVSKVLGRTQPMPLNPWKPWPSPKAYWDLVQHAADDNVVCSIALAIRTDDPTSESHRRVRELLEFLPDHPIARRLMFVDPLAPEIRATALGAVA